MRVPRRLSLGCLISIVTCLSDVGAAATASARSPLPPSVMHVCLAHCGTWYLTLDGKGYAAAPDSPGTPADNYGIHIRSFTPESVVLDRYDEPNQYFAQGLKAVISGRVSKSGNRLEDGQIEWTFGQAGTHPARAAWGSAIDQIPGAGDPSAAKADSIQPDAGDEQKFMAANSTQPPDTMGGYQLAILCFDTNTYIGVKAQDAGDSAAKHRADLGSKKSWVVADQIGNRLGLTDEQFHEDMGADKTEIDSIMKSPAHLQENMRRCRRAGLLYEDTPEARAQRAAAPAPAPDPKELQVGIDRAFQRWAQSWFMDQYVAGSAHIENTDCNANGCVIRGHFTFVRGGAAHSIEFAAEMASDANEKYQFTKLCYNDTTSGMQDCAQ